ncbi:MAG TPA: hypothetical protein VHU82_08755 [Vicinamibacterales bacterium]|jgi:hypothetical protein|nr:hypothetical protein [Vicinamibacterales bacterium]
MRSSSSLVRSLVKGGGLVLLWLLVPSIALAAQAGVSRGRVCDPQAGLTLHKLVRVTKSLSGPVAHPYSRGPAGLIDEGLRLQHAPHTSIDDDDAVIQNDAPAAFVDADTSVAFALEPIGVLARACVRQPKAHDFSPRSPRGPPVAG